MKKTIAAIHATIKAVGPMMEEFRILAPNYEIRNFVNEEMLSSVNRKGHVGKDDLRMFTRLMFEAMDAPADCILVCCSIFCSYVPIMREFTDIPIVAINVPMLERAARIGGTIGIISTTPASAPHTQAQIEAILSREGRQAQFCHEIVPGAMDSLKKGDAHGHDQIIADAILRLKQKDCSCAVLSQITMAGAKHLLTPSPFPILTSPEEGVRKICSILK